MLIADKDVVCGIYPKKEVDWARVARAVEDGVPPDELIDHAGSFAIRHLDDSVARDDVDVDELFEIEGGGTGFMLIKRAVFDALADDVGDYKPEYKFIKEFYATVIEPESRRLVTEDYQFCRLARRRGFKIYAAPWVRLAHAGTYIFERRYDPAWFKLND